MVFIVTAVLLVFPAVVFVAVVSTVVFLIILFLTHHHVDQEEKEKKKRSVGWKPHPYLNSDQTPSFPPPRLTSSDQTVSSPQEPKAHCAPNPPTPRFSPIVVRSQLHWEEPTLWQPHNSPWVVSVLGMLNAATSMSESFQGWAHKTPTSDHFNHLVTKTRHKNGSRDLSTLQNGS